MPYARVWPRWTFEDSYPPAGKNRRGEQPWAHWSPASSYPCAGDDSSPWWDPDPDRAGLLTEPFGLGVAAGRSTHGRY